MFKTASRKLTAVLREGRKAWEPGLPVDPRRRVRVCPQCLEQAEDTVRCVSCGRDPIILEFDEYVFIRKRLGRRSQKTSRSSSKATKLAISMSRLLIDVLDGSKPKGQDIDKLAVRHFSKNGACVYCNKKYETRIIAHLHRVHGLNWRRTGPILAFEGPHGVLHLCHICGNKMPNGRIATHLKKSHGRHECQECGFLWKRKGLPLHDYNVVDGDNGILNYICFDRKQELPLCATCQRSFGKQSGRSKGRK